MTYMSGKGIWRFKGGVFRLYSCFFLSKKKNKTKQKKNRSFLMARKKNSCNKVKVMQAYQNILSI